MVTLKYSPEVWSFKKKIQSLPCLTGEKNYISWSIEHYRWNFAYWGISEHRSGIQILIFFVVENQLLDTPEGNHISESIKVLWILSQCRSIFQGWWLSIYWQWRSTEFFQFSPRLHPTAFYFLICQSLTDEILLVGEF